MNYQHIATKAIISADHWRILGARAQAEFITTYEPITHELDEDDEIVAIVGYVEK